MALTQPILNSIAAFDATQEHIFSFISIGGDQVLGSQLTIYDNETGAQVYQGNYTSFKFEHPLAAGTLTNGKYYNATISTINNASEFSEPSNPVAFYCYTTPVLTITNIPASGTIEQSNYTFQGNYVQAEGELLNGYQYTLYDSNKEQISQSAILYDGLYQHTFSGMANDTSYYVELSGSTINNTPVSSGLLLFTIRYIQPASFAICDLVNNCQNGFIQISSNIVSIDGKSEPDPPKYIDNKEVDLTDDGSWVQWDEGFNIQNDFTMRIWGRSFGDNEPIVTMKNELDTNNAPNRIEMKFMATDIIDTLPNYIFAEGDIVTTENAVNEPITDLNIGGNSYQKVVQASSESAKFESDNGSINDANPELGAELDTEGNSYQETTQGKNLFDNTLKGYAYYGNPAKTISTGIRLSVSSPTTTSDTIFVVYSIMDLSNFVGKTVRMKATYKSNSALIGEYKIGLCDDKAGNRKTQASSSSTGQEISFVVPELIGEQKYLAIWFYANAGGTGAAGDYVDYTNVIITIDNEDMTYEPYTGGIPSPNPEYPQEIEVIDGYNKLDFKTMLKNAGAEFTESKGIFAISPRGELYSKPFKLNLKPNCTYTMYQECQMQETPNLRLEILKGETYDVVATSWTSKEDLQDRKVTFTTDENSNYYIRGNWGAAVEPLIYNQPILVEGTELKPYLPYGSIGLKQSGKNLFDESYYSNKILYKPGNLYFAAVEMPDSFKTKFYGSGFLKAADKDLVFGFSNSNLSIPNRILASNHVLNKNVEYDFTNADKVYFVIGNGNRINIDTDIDTIFSNYNIMVTTTEATSYEPYHEPKVISINLNGNTLAKVGDVKDILKVNRNGEVEIEKNTWKDTINTSSLITLSNGNKGLVFATSKNKTESMSNSDYLVTNAQRNRTFNNGTVYQNQTNFVFVGNSSDTLESIQAKFNGGGILYQLKTPQTIKLPSIEPIELWEGTNIFELITNLGTVFSITYNIIDASPAPDNPSEVHFTGDIGNQIDFPDTSVSYTDGLHVAAKPNNNYILLPNRIYTLNFDYVVTNSTTDIYYGIGYGTKDNYVGALTINGEESIQYATQNKGSNSITFQTPATFEGVDTPYLWIDFAKTTITATVAVDISNVSLYFGEYTEYQTYGRYNVPFKILGQNLFNYQKLLYFIDNNTTHEVISNGYSVNPTVQNSDCYVSIGYTNNLVAGEKYTLSYQTLGNVTSFNLYAVEKGTSEIANEITLTNGVFVAPNNNYDLMLKLTLDSSNLTNNVNIWNIQIVKGEELLDYATYTENGLNMDFEQPLRGIGNVRDCILLDNVNLINPTTLRANVKENTTYYFSSSTSNSYLLEFYNIENNLIDTEDISSGTFTTPANCVYVTSEDFTALNVIPEHIQIEEGNTFSQYFPYISQPSVVRNIGKIDLKDIPSWFQDKELSNSNRFYTNEIIYANSSLALSNYFKYSNIQNINTVDEQGLCVVNNRQIALRINKTLVTNVDELKQWLLKRDVEVYYRLSTPQVHNLLGDYEKVLRNFVTQVGTNNILIDSQYPGYLRLKYANSYTEQGTKANYVLLKCWNENTIPYMIHSNYITVKSPKDKIFIWTRRKNNIFDLKIENLGEE